VSNVGSEDVYEAVKADVKHFCRQFPLYPSLNYSVDEVGKRIGEAIEHAADSVADTVKSIVDEVTGAVKA
jgi:hypothetical protein